MSRPAHIRHAAPAPTGSHPRAGTSRPRKHARQAPVPSTNSYSQLPIRRGSASRERAARVEGTLLNPTEPDTRAGKDTLNGNLYSQHVTNRNRRKSFQNNKIEISTRNSFLYSQSLSLTRLLPTLADGHAYPSIFAVTPIPSPKLPKLMGTEFGTTPPTRAVRRLCDNSQPPAAGRHA